jgi:hypothetical protein
LLPEVAIEQNIIRNSSCVKIWQKRKRKVTEGSKVSSMEEYLKQLPPTQEEYVFHELKMEKRLKAHD